MGYPICNIISSHTLDMLFALFDFCFSSPLPGSYESRSSVTTVSALD